MPFSHLGYIPQSWYLPDGPNDGPWPDVAVPDMRPANAGGRYAGKMWLVAVSTDGLGVKSRGRGGEYLPLLLNEMDTGEFGRELRCLEETEMGRGEEDSSSSEVISGGLTIIALPPENEVYTHVNFGPITIYIMTYKLNKKITIYKI